MSKLYKTNRSGKVTGVTVQSDKICLRFGKVPQRHRFYLSFGIGVGRTSDSGRLRIDMTRAQTDAFFANLAAAVGHDAPYLSFPMRDGYTVRAYRCGVGQVAITLRRRDQNARVSITARFTVAQASELCEAVAPMIGWSLKAIA